MCYVLYIALAGLLFLYTDSLLDQYALSVQTDGPEWMVVSLGWEMALILWPLLLMAMVIASGVTLLFIRRLRP